MPERAKAFVDFQAVILVGPGHQLAPLVDTAPLPKVSLKESNFKESYLSSGGTGVDFGNRKAFLPIANKPMLAHVLSWLAESGISNIILVCNPVLAIQINKIIEGYCPLNTQVSIVPFCDQDRHDECGVVGGDDDRQSILSFNKNLNDSESSLLSAGTMAAMLAVKPFIRNDFILLPCDLITDAPLAAMADLHRSRSAMATLLLCRSPQAASSKKDKRWTDFGGGGEGMFVGLVDGCSKSSRVAFLKSQRRNYDGDSKPLKIPFQLLARRHPRIHLRSDLRDVHCYMFSKEIFEQPLCSANNRLRKPLWSVREDLIPALVPAGLYAFLYDNEHETAGQFCMRANTPQALLECTKMAMRPKDSISGLKLHLGEKASYKKSCLGSNVSIGSNSKITNSLIMDNIVIQANCKLDGCILGSNVIVKEDSELKDCIVGPDYVIERKTIAEGETFSIHDQAFSDDSDEDKEETASQDN